MTQTVNNAMAYIISLTPFVGYHNVPMAILTLLVDMNFQTHWDGFFYLRQAILIQSKHPGMRISAIYQEIARGLEDDYLSSRQIAQAIHASIADAFQNRNPDCWNKIFDEELWDSAPANNVFISRLGCLMELWDSRKEDLDGIE